MGGGFHQMGAFCAVCGKAAAPLDGHADGLRGACKLGKRIEALFIRILPQQQPDILPPRGADAFRIVLRAGEKLPGLQERMANFVVNAGLCAQNLFFPRRLLHVLTILPEPPVHGFQAKIVLFQFPLKPRFLGDIRASDLVNNFPDSSICTRSKFHVWPFSSVTMGCNSIVFQKSFALSSASPVIR